MHPVLTSFCGTSVSFSDPQNDEKADVGILSIFLTGRKLIISSDDSDMIVFNDCSGWLSSKH